MQAKSISLGLVDLIDYYRQCLALERQGEVALRDAEFFGAHRQNACFHPINEVPNSWESLLSTPAAHKAMEQIRQRTEQVVLFAPCVAALQDFDTGQRRWEPVAGIFCLLEGNRLHPDPSDLYLGRLLSSELSPEDLSEIRAQLETAARKAPTTFCQLVRDLLRQRNVTLTSLADLKSLEPPTVVAVAGFWVVGEPSYDRYLLEELEQMRSRSLSGTALAFLFQPPKLTEPLLEDVLLALANPITPTLSQAIALAHAMQQPLTVVTGPPGTGKTRLIVGLIIHSILTGHSVLLASRINRAVDAAVELAEKLMGKGCILRTGNEEARNQLRQTISELLDWREWTKDGEFFRILPDRRVSLPSLSAVSRELPLYAQQLRRICLTLNRLASKLQPFGLRPAEGKWKRFWWHIRWHLLFGERRWRAFYAAWREGEELLERMENEWLPQARHAQIAALHERLTQLLRRGRETLQELLTALDDRRRRLQVFEQLARLGFPIALSTLSVGQNLPLKAGMVDTLILDEASSCDPASVLPLMYRARRVLIVGDPKQLDHVTKERWRRVKPAPCLRSGQGKLVDASFGVSAFKLIHSLVGERTFWLIDHFRCPPPIIAFSNDAFYGGRLRIHTVEKEVQPIMLHWVAGRHQMRNNSLTNREQLKAVWLFLSRWAKEHPDATLGLVAPYRAFIDDALQQLNTDPSLSPLRELWEKQRLIVGTAHRFQGSEVDYLVFATVAGDNAGERERRWIEFPNLFNVAITRTRRQMVILVDPVFERHLTLTKRLLRATPIALRDLPSRERGFVKQVSEELRRLGISHRCGCSFHGDPVDLLDEGTEPRWCAVLWGWEEASKVTPMQLMEWLERKKTLQKRGLIVYLVFPPDFDRLLADLLPFSTPFKEVESTRFTVP
jgi:Superfamily I DNA and RNA helicases and helicase subunits